jgi:hypothetical protein
VNDPGSRAQTCPAPCSRVVHVSAPRGEFVERHEGRHCRGRALSGGATRPEIRTHFESSKRAHYPVLGDEPITRAACAFHRGSSASDLITIASQSAGWQSASRPS